MVRGCRQKGRHVVIIAVRDSYYLLRPYAAAAAAIATHGSVDSPDHCSAASAPP